MILHTPTKTIKDGQVTVAAHFEFQTHLAYLPHELWYRFPEKYAQHLSLRADAFTPAALLMAMYAGENLQIRGAISPKLAYNLFEYRTIFNVWYPDLFQKIEIQYDHLEPSPQFNNKTAVATAFSGGVDSFYTLWAHRPQNQPIVEAQITHGLFVHGLDLRLADEANYRAAAEPYSRLFEEQGLELIQAATNASLFSEFRINWTIFHGVSLIGAALCLDPFLARFYMPSSLLNYNKLIPYGSSPLIDHLLSTETIQIINHGTNIKRSEKTAYLVQWQLTHHKLRVCSNKTRMHGLDNCCACTKCYRMMIQLELFEASHHYQNFSKKMTFQRYLHWGLLHLINPRLASELRSSALSSGKLGMVLGIQMAIIISMTTNWGLKAVKYFLSHDQLYRLKRVVYQPETSISETKS